MVSMSNKRVLFLCLFMLAFMQISAQHVSYKTFQKYALEVYDVVCKKPRGFIDLRTSVNWWPGGTNCGVGFMYDPVFRSKSGDCLIMYPTIGLWSTLRPPVREQLAYEINATLGWVGDVGKQSQQVEVDFEKYVTIWVDDARQYFNADTVFIAQLPIKNPYKEMYNYCTSVYVYKKDRPVLLFKFFFTEEGKQHEQEYLNKLCKRIWYRKGNWVYDKERVIQADYDILYRDRYK